jgi:hypothetical protein
MNKELFRLHPSAFILAFQRRPVNPQKFDGTLQ